MFAGSFAMAMSTLYAGKSGMPWWGLIVGIIISTIFLPFVVTVYAITGTIDILSVSVQSVKLIINSLLFHSTRILS